MVDGHDTKPFPTMLLTNNGDVDPVAALDAIEGVRRSLITERELNNAYTNAIECDEGRSWLREKGIVALDDFRNMYRCVVEPPARPPDRDIAPITGCFFVCVSVITSLIVLAVNKIAFEN
jgi:hypothetical protein